MKYLPKFIRAAVLKSWQQNLPGRAKLAGWAVRLAQHRAQAAAFKQRQAVVRSDLHLDEALAFANGETI